MNSHRLPQIMKPKSIKPMSNTSIASSSRAAQRPVFHALAAALLAMPGLALAADATPSAAAAAGKARPALSVSLAPLEEAEWTQTLAANGSVAAWQETIVGAEIAGLRLAEVRVNVGDTVKRGQLLALLSASTVQAELAQSRAAAAEAEALWQSARGDAERARQLQSGGSGALSAQQLQQYLTQEQTAKARLDAATARVDSDQLRLAQTRISASDDGVISARAATVGAVVQPGQELFRLIRQGRLEWRAELPAAELPRLKPGLAVRLQSPDGSTVNGRLRMVAPTVDAQSRLGLAYVDLPASAGAALRAGSFVRGEFLLGQARALSLPQTAVQLRDGNSYAYRVGADQKVQQVKISTGRRVGERVEVLSGLDASARVVKAGVGFLSDGDLVRVVGETAAPAAPAAPAAAAKK